MDVEFSSEVRAGNRAASGARHLWLDHRLYCAVYLIGFPITVPLFIFLYLKFQSEVTWLWTIVVTAITWGCFHLLFQSLVHIQFETGAIQTWLGL